MRIEKSVWERAGFDREELAHSYAITANRRSLLEELERRLALEREEPEVPELEAA